MLLARHRLLPPSSDIGCPRSPAPLSSLWLTNTRTRHSVKLTDGRFPKEAVELFRKHGVEQPHLFEPDEDGEYVDKEIRPVRDWMQDKARPPRPSH